MFDIIGIDWGQKRVGLAFASSSSQLILAADYACYTNHIWNILDQEVCNRKTKKIIIGRPVNFNQQDTIITNKIDSFVAELKARYLNLDIITINERNSSADARFGGMEKPDKQQLNHLSAVKILEYYFGIEKR